MTLKQLHIIEKGETIKKDNYVACGDFSNR